MDSHRIGNVTLPEMHERFGAIASAGRDVSIAVRTDLGDEAVAGIEAVAPLVVHLHTFASGMSESGTSRFVHSLLRAPKLQSLGIHTADLRESGCYALARTIGRLGSLRTLTIFGPVRDGEALMLACAIKASPTLRRVELCVFGAGEDTASMHILMQAIQMSSGLKKRAILVRCAEESCDTAIMSFIAQSIGVRHGAPFNVRCPYTGVRLARASMNASLEHLEFAGSALSDANLQKLEYALEYDPTVRTLRIHGSSAGISSAGTECVIRGLRRHQAMREISVEGTFDEECARQMAAALAEHTGVERCNMRDAALTDAAKKILEDAALQNPHIRITVNERT